MSTSSQRRWGNMYKLKKIEKSDFETIADWHKEHAAINFPDSKYKRDLFLVSLKKDYHLMMTEKDVILYKLVRVNEIVSFLWLKKIFEPYKDYFYCDLHYILIFHDYAGRGWGG